MSPKIYKCETPAAPGEVFMIFAGLPAFLCKVTRTKSPGNGAGAMPSPVGGFFYAVEPVKMFNPVENPAKFDRILKKMADWYFFNYLKPQQNGRKTKE